VRISVREGVQYAFGQVAIITTEHGESVLDPGRLRSRTGRPFEKDLVFRDRREVLNAYGDAGFLHARSTETLTPDTLAKTVHLEFLVEPGPAVVFDTLMIRNGREGDTTGAKGVTRENLLRDLLRLQAGDTVSLSSMAAYERKIKSTRVFNYVRLRDSLLSSRGVRSALILTTEERVPGEADGSVFLETQYGAGVAVNWNHGNMLGNLHEGKLGASLAQRKQTLFIGYASPLFFGTSFRFDDDLVANWYQDSRLQRSAGIYEGDFEVTNSSKLSRVFTSWSRGVSNTELTDQSRKIDTNTFERFFNLNFINTAFLTFLDATANPTKGVRWAFTWGNGGSFLTDGQIDVPITDRHNWLEVESAYYLPLTDRIKLAFRMDGGRFFGSGDQNAERFFLGGPRTVRSFGWRQVCPDRDTSTGICAKAGIEPAYFLGSFEIRTNPFSPTFINPDGRWAWLFGLQVVPFIDHGNVWEVGKSIQPEGTGRAYGLGLRYSLLSIFNFRLDYAVDGPERENSQWVIDLAQAF
jgi:outer membrane protein insertion porin family